MRSLGLVTALAAAVLAVLALAGCVLPLTPGVPQPPASVPPTTVVPATVPPTTLPPTVASPTSYPCPQPTAEYLAVEPVTSPTGELSQVVTVHMGNLEMVTITAESGVFTATDAWVEVALLPNTSHHLEVEAKVRRVTGFGDCTYGGYTLRTTTDRYGAPLVIVQGQPGTPRAAAEVIAVDNAARLEMLASFSPEARLVTDFAFLGNDELLSVGYGADGGRIYGWSLITGKKTLDLSGPAEALAVAASPDGTLVATGGTATDPAVRLWEVHTGKMRELGRHDTLLASVAFSPSGALLASGDSGDTVRVWQVNDGQLTATFKGNVPKLSQRFGDLYWPDERTLIAGGSTAIYWWDVATGQTARQLDMPAGIQFMVGVAFADGGERIAAAAQDNQLYVWDEGWTAWLVPEEGIQLAHVAFSPDGRLVAATTYDGLFYVWDAARGALLVTRSPGGPAGGAAIRFSPDGRYLATGGWQAPIRVWGVP